MTSCQKEKVAVFGAGSFGTAIAWMLSNSGNHVSLWCFDPSDATYINATGRNPLYLSNLHLDSVEATTSVSQTVTNCQSVIIVTPSFAVRSVCISMAEHLGDNTPVAILSKGLDPTSGSTLYETALEVLGNAKRICVVSGPNHAEELANGSFAGAVVASQSRDAATYFQNLLMTDTFRLYTSDDPIGVSLCAAAKNVIAIACGMARGMGQGDNTISLLMTRGLAEITRLVESCGGSPITCLGLAGVGDLNTTCNSPHSRNGSFGEAFARESIGVSEYEARRDMVVEGAHSLDSLLALGKRQDVELPIMTAVNNLLEGRLGLDEAAIALMTRSPKPE